MSNYLGIATATATLCQLLDQAVGTDVNGAKATTLRPNAPSGLPNPGVNLYLFQVTPNAALRNADTPTRGPDGGLVQRPRAALDLHYLLSFYGKDTELEPQRVLGSAIRLLHDQPILTRARVRETIDAHSFLGGSDLDEAVESIKLSQLPLTLEELAKLWSVFFQTPYVLSVAYQASVVLVEGQARARPTLPVRERNLYVVPARRPVVEQVMAAAGPRAPILAGGTLRILGTGLRGDLTRVRIGDTRTTPAPDQTTDTAIELVLPATLRAGIQAVQVEHPRALGTPATLHAGTESNAVPFVLQPTIVPAVGGVTPTLDHGAPIIVDGLTLQSATITVSFTPPVGRTARVRLSLYETDAPPARPPRAYTLDAPLANGIADPNQPETTTIAFALDRAFPGTYLVRAQVDGAESPLGVAADGRFTTPAVTI